MSSLSPRSLPYLSSPPRSSSPRFQQDNAMKRFPFGILLTGYITFLEPNALTRRARIRYIVLTRTALHCFRRHQRHDLFGKEQHVYPLSAIANAISLANTSTEFSLKMANGKLLSFIANTKTLRDTWVDTIQGALRGEFADVAFEPEQPPFEPALLLICMVSDKVEIVQARDVCQGDVVLVRQLPRGGHVQLCFDGGATAMIDLATLQLHAKGGAKFAVSVQGFDVPADAAVLLTCRRQPAAATASTTAAGPPFSSPLTTPSMASIGREGSVGGDVPAALLLLSLCFACQFGYLLCEKLDEQPSITALTASLLSGPPLVETLPSPHSPVPRLHSVSLLLLGLGGFMSFCVALHGLFCRPLQPLIRFRNGRKDAKWGERVKGESEIERFDWLLEYCGFEGERGSEEEVRVVDTASCI